MDADFAGALEAARGACDALRAGDPLQQKMRAFVDAVADAHEHGLAKPTGRARPDKKDFLNTLHEDSPLRPARQRAFDALEALLEVGWPPHSGAQRKAEHMQRKRQKQADDTAAGGGEADKAAMYYMIKCAWPAAGAAAGACSR